MRNNGGMPNQVDSRPFKVGENIASSKGAVIYKNEMLEIIQYQPLTDQVYKIPILIIPPQINKFFLYVGSYAREVYIPLFGAMWLSGLCCIVAQS